MTDLKIIGAGLGRTGTKSLQEALILLGYKPCYHMAKYPVNSENVDNEHSLPIWKELFDNEVQDKGKLKQLFKGYVATTDYPACLFYKEFLKWNPDAKVILTVRDEPQQWVESARATIFRGSPVHPQDSMQQKVLESFFSYITKVHGVDLRKPETDLRKLYLDWIGEVKRNVKEENLLVFNVKEGWGPLCQFLGVPEPKQAFPNVNSREDFLKRVAERLAKRD